MNEIIVTSQAELDAVSADFDGRIIIKFGTPYNRAVVNRAFKCSVEARSNSSVVAWDNSSVVAYDNSSVVAWDNSSVVAYDNSSVVAYDNSSVEAWDNSSVEARSNSSVVAWDNSSVEAWDNSQVVDVYRRGNIKTSGNARVVYNPSNIEEYIDFHGIETEGDKVKLFKAVHFDGTRYFADADWAFTYPIGKTVKPDNGFDDNPKDDCGAGIHMAHKAWAVDYGRNWSDLAILELEVDKADVLVPLYGSGKVRAKKAKVLREVPLEECGLLGKMLAKQRETKK